MLRSRARTATIDESVAKKMKEHQGELVKQKQDEGLKRFKGEDGAERDANEEAFKKYESYRRENMLPTKVDELRVGFFLAHPDHGRRARPVAYPADQFVCGALSYQDSEAVSYTHLRAHET